MKIRVLRCAESEIADAMDYYNSQYAGLGYEFAIEVKESMKRILAYPTAWPLFKGNTRKYHMNRFPYGLVFEKQNEIIYVIAVMHLSQRPEKWDQRLKHYID